MITAESLAFSELIIYGACSTAEGGENANNIVTYTRSADCKTVIGFEESVISKELNMWCEKFFEELATGKTVTYACSLAVNYVKNYKSQTTISSCCIVGNKTATFCS